MKIKAILFAGAASLTLISCGKKDEAGPETKSSAAAARPEAGSPLDAPFKLAGAEPIDVDALFSLLPEEAAPSYDSAAFDEKLGATVVTNLRIIDRDPDNALEFDGLTIERTELYGVDMEAIERVKAAEATADAPFEKIFDKVRLFGVKPASPDAGAQTTIGGIELDQFRLRQGGFKADKEGDDNPAFFFNAFDLAGLYFKDFIIDGADEQAGDIKVKAPDLRFVGLGGGKLNAVIAKDFEYEVKQSPEARAAMARAMGPGGALMSGPLKGFIAPDHQRTKMESLEWRGVDFSGLMAYGLKDEEPPVTAKNLIDLGSIKALDMETFIGERRAAKVAETKVDRIRFTWLIPSDVHSVSKGGEYDLTAYVSEEETEAVETLKKHGLDMVKGESELSWTWDAAQGGANLGASFVTDKLADFSLDFALAGLELEKINALIEAGEENAIAKAGAFKGFGATLIDKTLLDAIYDVSALQMGGDGEDLRQSTPAMVRLTGIQAASINPRIADYVDALANFLADGGTLEIAARPEQAVPLEAIAAAGDSAPQTLPDLLNLTVTHKEK